MLLANIDVLTSEEVQLLADCSQAVFVLEIPPVAEMLIQRGLLLRFPAVCQHSSHQCFLLAATESGRLHVDGWIERHGNEASAPAGCVAPAVLTLSAAAACP